MKNCRNIENNLPLYLDDLLPVADKKAIEEHLKSCAPCSKKLAQLSKTRMLVSNLGDVEPPAWFKQKTMARVRQEAEKESVIQKWFYPLRIKIPVQIFATVFIAVLAVYIYRSGEQPMKEVASTSVPAPVTEVQTGPPPEQKLKPAMGEITQKGKTAEEETIHNNEMPRNSVRESAVYKTEDSAEGLSPDIKKDKDQAAPAAKSVDQPEVKLEKQRAIESGAAGTVMKDNSILRAQSPAIRQNILLRVDDVSKASDDVETLITKYKAKKISGQKMSGKITLAVEMKNQMLKEFVESLKKVGQTGVAITSSVYPEENILLTIEIVKN